jgi:glycosyltransferase involved in cell wall biosynthesis/predicted O-methyltransferase YrrM
VRTPGRSLCLAVNEIDGLQRNGGIGTYNWLTAQLLAKNGWRVHILYCGADPGGHALQGVNLRLRAAGIGFSWIGDFEMPRAFAAPGHFRHFHVNLSEHARVALEELHRTHSFDLIEFADWGALGFRAIQARRCGSALTDVRMLVKLHSSSQWMRQGNGFWPCGDVDLQLDYCERYAFENADVQASPSRYMLEYARSVGWNVRGDARVIANPVTAACGIVVFRSAKERPFAERKATMPQTAGLPELVFFGRLETRKGLELFLDAIERLPANVAITFLGRENDLSTGENALEVIAQRLRNRSHKVLDTLQREVALAYLAEGNRLAVMPSLSDNYPYVLLECLQAGIPFITTSVGGIPEILTVESARQHLCCEPTGRDLARCLNDYLRASPTERAQWQEQACSPFDPDAQNARFVKEYERLLAEIPTRRPEPLVPTEPPLVSVVVPYFNMPNFLPETLASLAGQTWPRLEVLVVDDGSDDPEAIRVFHVMQQHYPQFRFMSQANQGIGATRNRGLFEAKGEFFVCTDSDNIAHPKMIERLVKGLRHRPDCSALSCYYLAFADSDALARGEFEFGFRPAGGPHVLAAIRNIYGDANAIYRTADFRAVGGFETDRGTSFEDWEAFVKLVNAGKRVDVLPEHLFYYRHLDSGFSRLTNDSHNRQRVLRQFKGVERLPIAEQLALWQALVGYHIHMGRLIDAQEQLPNQLRYRVADKINNWIKRLPILHSMARAVVHGARKVWRACKGLPAIEPVKRSKRVVPADQPVVRPLSPVTELVQPPPESPLLYHSVVPGWFDYEDLYDAALRKAGDGDIFVEVGAFLGRSTIYLASRIKQSGKKIRFYVVDLWDGWFRNDYQEQTPMRESRNVFWHFLRHLRAAKVDDVVIPLKMSSLMAARLFDPSSLAFVFLDADHSEKAVREDLEAWYPLVKPGGVIGVHDYDNPTFPGVEKAVDPFLEEQRIKGRPSRGVAIWFRKPRATRVTRRIPASRDSE